MEQTSKKKHNSQFKRTHFSSHSGSGKYHTVFWVVSGLDGLINRLNCGLGGLLKAPQIALNFGF